MKTFFFQKRRSVATEDSNNDSMSNSDQRIELLEDPGSTTPLDYEKLYLEKQYQIKEPL